MLVTGHFMPTLTHVPSFAADEITAADAEPVALPLHDTQPEGHNGSGGVGGVGGDAQHADGARERGMSGTRHIGSAEQTHTKTRRMRVTHADAHLNKQ